MNRWSKRDPGARWCGSPAIYIEIDEEQNCDEFCKLNLAAKTMIRTKASMKSKIDCYAANI